MLSVRVLTVNVIPTVCLKKYWRAVHAVMLLIETALFQRCRPQSSQIHHLLFMLFNSNLSTSHVLLGCSIYHISLAEAGGDRQTTNSHHACLSWYTHTVIHYASCACAHTHTNTLQPHPKTHSFTPRSTSLPSHPCPQCIWLWTYSTEMESFCFPSVRVSRAVLSVSVSFHHSSLMCARTPCVRALIWADWNPSSYSLR